MITPAGRPIVLAITDSSVAGEARRSAIALADRFGFDETSRGRLALVATESATNLHKHARGGEIVLQGFRDGPIGGVDVLSLDRGPGMADPARCLEDGYSTAGSSGSGLGAIGRLSARFDVHSLLGVGSTTLARLWAEPRPEGAETSAMEFGAVCVPLGGEEVCGDSWAMTSRERWTSVLVVDGLGHGPQAAEAAREALRVFGEEAADEPGELIRACHAALRATRGAALAVARVDPERSEVRFAGVGNVAGVILSTTEDERSISMVSHNGTVGHTIRKIQEFTYPWAPGSLLIMHSDGLGSQWRLDRYAGLRAKHPGLVAGTLYRDFKRGRDDTTIVAVKAGEAVHR